jgi:signal transduction histidine kinase
MTFRARRIPIDLAHARVRRTGFWGGWVGLAVTLVGVLTVVALLVGWVVAFASGDDGPVTWLLVLGPVAFSGVLVILGLLFFQLRHAERRRQAENAFLTGASHNLRTPLSAIRAAAQTLTDPGLDPDDRRTLLDAVLHETNRLELRIDTLLETARIDFERRPYLTERVELVALVADIARDARWSFVIRSGALTFRVDDGAAGLAIVDLDAPSPTALHVQGDRRALRILFENLIDNAIKSVVTELRVEVSIVRSADHVVVRVRDSGVGFAAEEADLLFSGRRPGDTRRRGTGLGLPLSRAIARGHGGELRLSSPGQGLGATAEVWLPMSRGDHDVVRTGAHASQTRKV